MVREGQAANRGAGDAFGKVGSVNDAPRHNDIIDFLAVVNNSAGNRPDLAEALALVEADRGRVLRAYGQLQLSDADLSSVPGQSFQ